jgi:hypothetical protein
MGDIEFVDERVLRAAAPDGGDDGSVGTGIP